MPGQGRLRLAEDFPPWRANCHAPRVPPTALWIAPALLAAWDWRAVATGDRRTETWAKPATMVALIGTAAALGALGSVEGRWLVGALALGLVGDVALLGSGLGRFRLGLAAFLLGHLGYVACFASLGLPAPAWSWLGLVVLGGTLLATRQVLPATYRLDGPALAVPVAAYTLVIGAMLLCGWWTGLGLVAAGASVFVVSDATLAVDRFVGPLPRAHLVVMVTYHVGQALITAGVLAAA